ncbi:PREDICTED: ACT domain-containing protein ACR1-like isoform X2 [Lupinus angustifolius]|uniref:ACT domain-containing protein ACR1-like isoform X2 n=1 Tax=Lupinus angustifolius TaxID=3871 RepID=UPI00092F60E3|nr:PREDICTED: ACT domain-containing protein ACR1-like isoform X2 [Lupinus angustifolius]
MEIFYQRHIDQEIESLIERIHPPRVCIDNDSCRYCSVVKVDSANKHGVLLDMVQVLTGLELIISRSYISSDGGWIMDVFHVTDQAGKKLTDQKLELDIQKALCTTRSKTPQSQQNVSKENTVLEMTVLDRPGLLSEISAVLMYSGCHVTSAMAWTHNDRAACIIYIEDATKHGPINDPTRLAQVEEQLENVVVAHGGRRERKSVRMTTVGGGCTHPERRLHQLLYADRDYESCSACHGDSNGEHKKICDGTHVSISKCEDKGYWVVNLRSSDRPKLLFDTVCVLTDMQYVVFHAITTSKSSIADQGLRVDICTENSIGLLSNVTRVFRENGFSISRVEFGTDGEKAVGTFIVTDSSGEEVNPSIAELVRQECGGTVVIDNKSPHRVSPSIKAETKNNIEANPWFSLGTMLWSQLERLSSNFGLIHS